VLLCAEEDDLALVQWVHAARERGLAPEIVTGVESDDAPLLDALADVGCALFVVLRSEHLDAARMRALKTAFGRHRRPEQRLFALRLDTGAATAVERIAGELAGGSRPRSEISMVISIDELFGADADHGADAGHGAGKPARQPEASPVPSVDRALQIGARAIEREVTAQFEVGDETIPMHAAAMREAVVPRRADRSRWAAWIGALGLAGAAAAAAMTVGPDAEVRMTAAHTSAVAPATIVASPEPDVAPPEPDVALPEPKPTRKPEPTEASTPRAPVDEPPVIIRVASEPTVDALDPVEAPIDPPRSAAPRHRTGRRAAATRTPIAMAAPAPAEGPTVEPTAVSDALPSEPAPLEAPAPASAATPAAPPPADDAPPTPTP
jgi:hypothetical protein